MRDDFTTRIKEELAKRVGFRCSNPNCRQQTSGPSKDPQKSLNIGVAAHIKAAAPGGKRYDRSQTNAERKDISNGLWLCQNCAKMIDSDAERYTVDLLHKWKELSETAALLAVESKNDDKNNHTINAEVVSINQSGGQTAHTIINKIPNARTLKHTREGIIAEMVKLKQVKYEIHILMNDMEAFYLAEELQEILVAAGWKDGKIIKGLGGTYPPGFLVTAPSPTKESEILTMVLYNSGLKGAFWAKPHGSCLRVYIGPNPDGYVGNCHLDVEFQDRKFC